MMNSDCSENGQEPGFYPRPRHELECSKCGLTMRVAAVDEKDHEGNIHIGGFEYACGHCTSR